MQVQVPDCGMGYTANVGAAVSDGLDFAAAALLTQRLKVSLTAAYADAHYTQSVAGTGALIVGRGDATGAVPLVAAPWTVTTAADFELARWNDVLVDVHAQAVFPSRNPGPFTSDNWLASTYAPVRRPNPSTTQVDIRASARWPRADLSVFIDNALNTQPTLQRRNSIPSDTLFYAMTLRPRTGGMSVDWRF